jgi:carbon-monoxide dehydrogenase medium subunit
MVTTPESLSWYQPTKLEEVQALLLRFPDATLLSGGQHLIPRWQETQIPETIVSLSHIEALRNIELNGNTLEIGAAVTLSELANSEIVIRAVPALSSLAGSMGDRFMRNRATIGGALCTTHLAGCMPAAMLGTNAILHTTARDIPSSEWFHARESTPILGKGELIVRVSLRIPTNATHQSLRLVPGRFALITVFAARNNQEFAVGISGMARSAFRATIAESWLARGDISDEVRLNQLFDEHPARTDIDASGVYREAQARRLLKNAARILHG